MPHPPSSWLIVAVVVVVTATSTSATGLQARKATSAPIVVKNCQTANCSGTCSTSSVPQNECLGGVKYSCSPSLSKCFDAVLFNLSAGAGTCSEDQEEGPASLVCNQCTPYPNAYQNETVYGAFRNCGSPSATFVYNCDMTCATCAAEVPVKLNTCTVNPIDETNAIIIKRVRQCNQLMTQTYWNNGNCSGTYAGQNSIPAASCMWDFAAQSSEFICPQ